MTLVISEKQLLVFLQHQTPDAKKHIREAIKAVRFQRKQLAGKNAYLAEKCDELCYHTTQAMISTPEDGHSISQHICWAYAAARTLNG